MAATAFEANEGIIVANSKGEIIRFNSFFSEMSGYNTKDVAGENFGFLLSESNQSNILSIIFARLKNKGDWVGEVTCKSRCGREFLTKIKVAVVKNYKQEVSHFVISVTDITQSKAIEDEIKKLAFYDELTGLANRRLLLEKISHACILSKRSQKSGALLFIDLDHFKQINDQYGHDAGDRFLQDLAGKLNRCVREADTVARFGGDEFVILLENLSENSIDALADVKRLCSKIVEEVHIPLKIQDQNYTYSISVGATLFWGRDDNIDEILKRADMAMYESKRSGRNTFKLFEEEFKEGSEWDRNQTSFDDSHVQIV